MMKGKKEEIQNVKEDIKKSIFGKKEEVKMQGRNIKIQDENKEEIKNTNHAITKYP